jgi:type I restriction enzyme, R subunit
MNPSRNRYDSANDPEKDEFKLRLLHYIEAYSFLTQIVSYADINLEKLFVFANLFAEVLPELGFQLPELRG